MPYKDKLAEKQHKHAYYLANIEHFKTLQISNYSNRIVNQAKYRSLHPSIRNHDAMMQRCYNSNSNTYADYGGRGITVYKPWHDFQTYEHDFGSTKPVGDYTVDRINNDGNYEPGNVQWILRIENSKKRWRDHARN